MPKELLNINEACTLLGGIGRSTFYRLLKAGEFGLVSEVQVKVGLRRVFFRRSILEAYLNKLEVIP